jgi:uncharacterized membrane protein
MPFRWTRRATHALSAAALSALLPASAAKHFREPELYHPLAAPPREEWIASSGLLEAGCAVGLLVPATRRVAAGCLTVMCAVYVAGHAGARRRATGRRQ